MRIKNLDFFIMFKLKSLINYIQTRYYIRLLIDYLQSIKKGNYWVSGVGLFMYYDDCEESFFYRKYETEAFDITYDINLNSSSDTFNWEQIRYYREIISNLDQLYKEIRTNDNYRDSKIILKQINISEPGIGDYDASLGLRINGKSLYVFIKDLQILRIE